MSIPSSSKSINLSKPPGGASPSPTEGIDETPGPSTLDIICCTFPENMKSEDYGDEGEDDEEDSSEQGSEVSK